MIQAVIFSKDRACQLDLLLRSIRMFWKGYDSSKITIIYAYSSEKFGSGYTRLMSLYPEFNFVKEKHILSNMLLSIKIDVPYTTFFVDDDIFTNEWNINNNDTVWNNFANFQNFVCLSLRLGRNISKNYESGDIPVPINIFTKSPCSWKWQEAHSDFAYPGSVDGHIFKTMELVYMLRGIDHCCNIEPVLMRQISENKSIREKLMICYDKSKIVNVPNNMIQTIHNNKHMNGSIEKLNELYVSGKHISLEPFININNDSCHYPMEYCFD